MAIKISRSPRYPAIGLPEAIERARAVYDNDYRNKIPKELVAQHMGYSTLNGASLGVISAVTKYGLLEGGAGSMSVSSRAVDIFAREPGDPERSEAIRQAAFAPEIFKEISEAFPGRASDAAIRSYLITKRQFLPDTTAKFLKSYRSTMAFLEECMTNDEIDSEAVADIEMPDSVVETKAVRPTHEPVRLSTEASLGEGMGVNVQIADDERELLTGMLSKGAKFRLIVSGRVGVREIEMLIKKLELDKEIMNLSEDDAT